MDEIYGYVLMDKHSTIICISHEAKEFLDLLDIKRQFADHKIDTQLVSVPKSIYDDIAKASWGVSESDDNSANGYYFAKNYGNLKQNNLTAGEKLLNQFS